MSGDKRAAIAAKLADKEFRDAYVASHLGTGLAFQIRANRLSRELTQTQLGELAGMKQTQVSRLEGPSHGRPNIATLLKLASAFDVALIVRFAPFSELLDWTSHLGETELAVPSFGQDEAIGDGAQSSLVLPANGGDGFPQWVSQVFSEGATDRWITASSQLASPLSMVLGTQTEPIQRAWVQTLSNDDEIAHEEAA